MSIMETDWRIKESNKQWIYVFAWYPFEYFLNVTKQTAKDIVRRKVQFTRDYTE